MTWTKQIKNLLVTFLLWQETADRQDFLLYTDGDGDTGRIILTDHRFVNQTKHTN